jgi:serine/threonine protein kinase
LSSHARAISRGLDDEVRILRTWKHDHILELLSAFKKPDDGRHGSFSLVFPFAEHGSLYDFLRLEKPPDWITDQVQRRRLTLCVTVMDQIVGLLGALSLMHNKQPGQGFLIHRDIKPSNILIHHRRFKLADFSDVGGIRQADETSKTFWYGGTKLYAPPEITKQGLDSTGRARDMWAIGCVIVEIVTLLVFGFAEKPAVEAFELERFESSGELETKTFSLTIPCVTRWIQGLHDRIDASGELNAADKFRLRALLSASKYLLRENPSLRDKADSTRSFLAQNIGANGAATNFI